VNVTCFIKNILIPLFQNNGFQCKINTSRITVNMQELVTSNKISGTRNVKEQDSFTELYQLPSRTTHG